MVISSAGRLPHKPEHTFARRPTRYSADRHAYLPHQLNEAKRLITEDQSTLQDPVVAFWTRIINHYFDATFTVFTDAWKDTAGKGGSRPDLHVSRRILQAIRPAKGGARRIVFLLEAKPHRDFRFGEPAWDIHREQLHRYSDNLRGAWVVSALAIGCKVRFYYWDRTMTSANALTITRGDGLEPATRSDTNLDIVEHDGHIHHILLKTMNKAYAEKDKEEQAAANRDEGEEGEEDDEEGEEDDEEVQEEDEESEEDDEDSEVEVEDEEGEEDDEEGEEEEDDDEQQGNEGVDEEDEDEEDDEGDELEAGEE